MEFWGYIGAKIQQFLWMLIEYKLHTQGQLPLLQGNQTLVMNILFAQLLYPFLIPNMGAYCGPRHALNPNTLTSSPLIVNINRQSIHNHVECKPSSFHTQDLINTTS